MFLDKHLIAHLAAPTAPPKMVKVEALDQHTLQVAWRPPPRDHWNGEILGYYVGYKLASSDDRFRFETVEFSKEMSKEHHLQLSNLKYSHFSIIQHFTLSLEVLTWQSGNTCTLVRLILLPLQ